VLENIDFYAGVYGLTRAEARRRSTWIVELAGLEAHLNDLATSLPMGLRQRLALGCALVHRPKVLFLDEPTSGVDPEGRRRFWQILFQLARSEGVAILITTHALVEAEHCDRVALMHAGRLVADASPSQLKSALKEEVGEIVELDARPQSSALRALRDLGHREAAAFGRRVHVFCRDPQNELEVLSERLRDAGVALHAAAVKPLTLEHVFVHRIGSLERGERRS
jgi:ABC-2 type transport system ATP-binding protein